MEITKRKTIHDNLKKYDYLSKDSDYIEVTEWTNGEGITVSINDDKIIDLTIGQLDAINYLYKSLIYDDQGI